MTVKVRGEVVVGVEFRIFEPPRFFEAFLRGRAFGEAPDITARVCGICPVAYQTSAVQAMEAICGVEVDEQLRRLRRLLYCGEWIESHALHVFLLHAPDFLGYASAIDMARDHAEVVRRGLDLKKAGNDVMRLVGGREVHPINVRVGGFYRVPTRVELGPLRDTLERARELALEAVRFAASLDFPDYERDYEFVALRHPGEYPIERGRIVSSRGLDTAIAAYDGHFFEEQVPWSNALHSRLRERGSYLVGPLARYALNADALSPLAREAAKEAHLRASERNPYRSIVVRCVEMVYAADEALRLLQDYEEPERPAVEVEPRAGVGHGCTEAPRGILYHRYEIDADGTIVDARMVPPTSQNQRELEDDLRGVLECSLGLSDDALSHRLEQTIRNYDPCISCATHFLKLELRRS
jgi:coenzyme F420-reducing hydrogenase alpha subunit